jgi:hypothetical protein
MSRFRILRTAYNDPYGREQNPYYWIEEKKSFLGIEYWKAIKHTECGWGDCYRAITQFKTEENAREHIQKVLCPGKKTDGHHTEIVGYVKCKK